MADEKPLTIKKTKKTLPFNEARPYCIIHSVKNTCDKDVKPLTETSFETIKRCQAVPQSQAEEVQSRMDDICMQIPDKFNAATHGHHRWCYAGFTNTARIVKKRTLEPIDED